MMNFSGVFISLGRTLSATLLFSNRIRLVLSIANPVKKGFWILGNPVYFKKSLAKNLEIFLDPYIVPERSVYRQKNKHFIFYRKAIFL
jgi:hypothetical protein